MDSIAFDHFAEELMGAANVLKIPTDCAPYEQGWRYGSGKAFRVLTPTTIEEISQLLIYCKQHQIAIVPQGGNTGLVAASVPDNSASQIVLSLSKLNKHVQINAAERQVSVSAGVILEVLNDMLELHGLWLPIDIGASGSCQVGGIVATNAAGTRAGRYGAVKDRLLSLKVLLADGTLTDIQCKTHAKVQSEEVLLQDNSFFDKANPFCGSAGWLGVVVEATFALELMPKGRASALLLPAENVDMDQFVATIKHDCQPYLSALEGVSDQALHMVAETQEDTPYLFDSENLANSDQRYALLMEFASDKDDSNALQEKLEMQLMRYMEKGLLQTARSDKPELFWHVRHSVSEAMRHYGEVIACDVAVPFGKLAQFRQQADAKLKEQWPFLFIVPFGHEMLGACHYNIIWPQKMAKKLTPTVREKIKTSVYELAVEGFQGTFSAEHGIGPHNQLYYDRFAPQAQKDFAKACKQQYDPKRIMNPNLYFD